MSRQNKNARKMQMAKQFTALHKSGQKGPSRTKKQSKKVNTWFAAKRTGRPIPQPVETPED